MKLVINGCYGGFSLSPEAMAAFTKRKGRACYFFKHNFKTDAYDPVSIEEASKAFMSVAFDIPNPGEVLAGKKNWNAMTFDERIAKNRLYTDHVIESRPADRADPDLVAVVEELGEKANGECADLRIVEIPDGVSWELDDYDGIESIHENHRRWS